VEIKTKLQVLLDIAKGLEAMHSVQIAHMDLKLENVLNFEETFKIIDLESSINYNFEVSEDVNIKSSLSIMPPELYVFDVNKLSTAVDIWS
jgi:serine/threonine protein kinase